MGNQGHEVDFLVFMLSVVSWPFSQPSCEIGERLEAVFSQGVGPRGPHILVAQESSKSGNCRGSSGSRGRGEKTIKDPRFFLSNPEAM